MDCGSYTGDTILQYMEHNGGVYDSCVCVEADADNVQIIAKNILPQYRVSLHKVACWNEKTTLLFDKIGSGSGTLNIKSDLKTEKIQIQADTIDHMMEGNRVSFIKMDIEGAEYKVLIGAVDTIQTWHPTLMISVYHKQDDLVKIPALIKPMNENYRFYLRHYRCMSVQETVLYAVE